MNLLYVENHARFADIAIRHFLSAHTLTVVPSVEAAQRALAERVFDIVLLDYDMDDGNGATLASELSQQAERPRMIAVSSHTEGNDALLRAGADGVCRKSDFSRIAAVIDEVCPTL